MGFQISSIYFQSINIYNQRVQSWLYLGSHQSWNVWSICPFVSTCLTVSHCASVTPSVGPSGGVHTPHSTLHTLLGCLSQQPASHLQSTSTSPEINIENSRTDSSISNLPGERFSAVQCSAGCSINWFLSVFSCLNPAKLLNGFNLAELCY